MAQSAMRFCQDHWDRLRLAIEERGLSHLIAPDGQTAMLQMADQLERGQRGEQPETPVNYDPLMSAHWAIVNNISAVGPGVVLELMTPNEDGSERCPLCYANAQHEAHCRDDGCTFTYDAWIDYAASDEAERVRAMREK